MVAGIAARPAMAPKFLIHTSGTGLLMHADLMAGTLGTHLSEKVYNDWEGVAELTSFPVERAALHRVGDAAAFDAAEQSVRSAIVSPLTIYSVTRGPAGGRGTQVYRLTRATLERKRGLQVNEGLAYWGNVHLHDLSTVYLRLTEQAAAGGGKAT